MNTTSSRLSEALNTPEDRHYAIESIMDKEGVLNTLRMMVDIAQCKSQHVLEAWQDESLANAWGMVANHLHGLAERESFKNRCSALGEEI